MAFLTLKLDCIYIYDTMYLVKINSNHYKN